ncbi:tetratricopeptide repeat protein (plasmid) [Ensifer adhaerens]|uniref:adenylate/guanylate cyclase domain-containing protein n=1 Tax=Ensifer adhaerens TaxID=106592 RepID=UPI001CBF8C6D|nr:adenylate/guanylate cyclase domain-containing protein [Ensifer adhaerens]MBZ7927101.1 tetratricopeptide repeat protein [Ensifer adhaerens]UAX98143.1 tetratricopeptide repeat protein [Ensifer adhaerens]UAY05525.1 tetratricopeptide repeat protein [Ensifer adhaerens]UAY12903.1 tetratricopeptide repeat protein [Ensifer adhaerens]
MTEEKVERRLAAILAADVVGYSRLMEANEERTLATLRQHRREFFDPTIAKHGGRIFKVMGDGFLVEFSSVLNATRCAVEIQRGMPERNAGIPEDRHIKFRIGINVGDLIIDGEDFYGDGVNVAARLEGLAGPGGVACSAFVRHQVGNKLQLEFLDQGEKTVKNIAQPVHVYFINLGSPDSGVPEAARERSYRPSVAILPFANMSNDPEQEFFSDGITEDIITDLSNVSGLFVLGRNTVFTHKGKAVNLEQIAKELGVAYLVEGSVRRAGNRVRINAQLIDGATSGHLWAARYDRELTDIFAIQDEITKTIVDQLKVKLLPDEKKAIELAPTDNIEAYTDYLRGRQLLHAATRTSLMLARRMFARATDLDPRFARAYAGMANCDSRLHSKHGEKISTGDILATTGKALTLEPDLAEAHTARAYALMIDSHAAEAAAAFEKALALDPNCYEAHQLYAEFFMTQGEFEQAARHYLRAMEIQPDDYQAPLFLSGVLKSLGRPEEAAKYARLGLRRAEEALRQYPDSSKPAQLGAVALAFLGERDRAEEWLARAMAIDPDDNLARYNAACTYSQLGKLDRAIELLEICLQQFGSDMKLWVMKDSDLDPVRNHPQYQKLLENVGTPSDR